eukprot:scaffold298213_cov24-Tisochrysis_lutea.AAC.1
MPEWEVKTAALISESAELKDMLKAAKSKYKEKMMAVGSQNKVLRSASMWTAVCLCCVSRPSGGQRKASAALYDDLDAV